MRDGKASAGRAGVAGGSVSGNCGGNQLLGGGARRNGGAAEMSQLAVLEEDLKRDTDAFPVMQRYVFCSFVLASFHNSSSSQTEMLMIDIQ